MHRCLRGIVQEWYEAELEFKNRDALKQDHQLDNWEKVIIDRFKIDQSEALKLFVKNVYTVENVRSKRSVSSYVQQVIRHAKNAEFILFNNQLNWAWMNLAAFLQRDVISFNDDIIIADFIKHLKHKQFTWRRFYKMKSFQTSIKKRWKSQSLFIQNQYVNRQFVYFFQQNTEYRQKDFYVNNSNYRNDRKSNNNARYDNNARNDRNYDQVNRDQYQVSANQSQQQQQRLLKASLIKQLSWTRFLQRASAIIVSASFQQTYYINQEKKNQQQNQNAYHEQESENTFLKSFLSESRSAMIDSYFNEHSELRYDLASYICDHCSKHYFFNNANELRKHVLEYHSVDIRFNVFKMQIRDLNNAQHAEKHVYNYASSNSFDYTTVEVEIFDLNLSLCIDSDEAVSLLNKFVLFRGNLYDIVHNALSIIITNVSKRQIASQMIKIDVELSFNKIPLKMIVYLVKNLFSELIIVNDVLNRLDVNLQHDNNIIKIENQEMSLSYSNADFSKMSYHYTVIMMRSDQNINKIIKKWRSQTFYISLINSLKFDVFNSCLSSTSNKHASINQASFSPQNRQSKCRRCKQIFDSNNQLHNHLTDCHIKRLVDFIESARRLELIKSWRRS